MSRISVPLPGCTPAPLASYLKALAVLRIVSEQRDPAARGWWAGDVFHLESELDQPGLVRFFLEAYYPTPMVAPWNGGSGFAEGDRTDARDAIRASTEPRFEEYRRTIDEILKWPELPPSGLTLDDLLKRVEKTAARREGKAQRDILETISDARNAVARAMEAFRSTPLALTIEQLEAETKNIEEDVKLAKKTRQSFQHLQEQVNLVKDLVKAASKVRTILKKEHRKSEKEDLVRACRDRLGEGTVEWLDAAVAIGIGDEAQYPPLLGVGGGEGRLDYTNTFMTRVVNVLLDGKASAYAESLLRNALFGEATGGLVVGAVGQYDPGRAGGYNQGPGIEHKDFPTNPWEFILALEGTISWASGVTVRQGMTTRRTLASPFTVRGARAVGYGSAAHADQQDARAEVWTPLWSRPVTYRELRALLAEGRAEVGGRRARNTIEFAEAAASLGVDRGIREFVRYSLLKRRGDSYVALPAGRFPVRLRTESDLIRQLDPILARLDFFLRRFGQGGPPARLAAARRGIDEAIYAVLLHGGPARLKAVVAAIGRMERPLAQRDPGKEPRLTAPLSGLGATWVVGADDGTVEVRIAAAFASIGATGQVGPLRANLAPIDPGRPRVWAKRGAQTAWTGRSIAARIATVLRRRMLDAERLGCEANPLRGELSLHPADIAAFIDGNVDEDLIEDLLFGFTWVRWDDRSAVRGGLAELKTRWSVPVEPREIRRSYALLKLLFLPEPVRSAGGEELYVRSEPTVVPLLCAGRVDEACRVAQRRLYAAGLAPVRASFVASEDGLRLAAALLLPIGGSRRISRLVLRTEELKQ